MKLSHFCLSFPAGIHVSAIIMMTYLCTPHLRLLSFLFAYCMMAEKTITDYRATLRKETALPPPSVSGVYNFTVYFNDHHVSVESSQSPSLSQTSRFTTQVTSLVVFFTVRHSGPGINQWGSDQQSPVVLQE